MGHRGRIVVERHGEREFFYVKGANTFHWPLVLGPEGVDRLIDWVPETHWIEASSYNEGGVYVNHDSLKLLWFGGEDDLYHYQSRQDLLALMAPAWEGWCIEWAHSGLHDIAREMSLPMEKPERNPARSPQEWSAILSESVDGPKHVSDSYFNSDFLVSINDGSEIRAVLGHNPKITNGSILDAPPEALTGLAGLTTQLIIEHAPNQGVHVDLEARTVQYWAGFYWGDLQHTAGKATNTEWDYEHLASEFPEHLALTALTVTSLHENSRIDQLVRRAQTLIYRNEFNARLSAWSGRKSVQLKSHDWNFNPDQYRIRLAISLHGASSGELTLDGAEELLSAADITLRVHAHLRRFNADYPPSVD